MPGCLCQGSPGTTTPPRTARTASRALTPCCSPGTASHRCLTCSACRPLRASRMTAASPCASISRPCPSRTTSRRGATQWSRANRLYPRQCWLASRVSASHRPSLCPPQGPDPTPCSSRLFLVRAHCSYSPHLMRGCHPESGRLYP